MLRDSDYDCILLDLRMPGISGMEVFEKFVASKPSHADRIIFMTGDTASPESAVFLSDKSNPVISKPFQLADVTRVIESVVSASPRPNETHPESEASPAGLPDAEVKEFKSGGDVRT